MLINKNFTFLFFSTLISGIGTGLTALGIAWVIQQLYDDFNALALLNTVGLVFAFIILPKFSLWVDRYSKQGIAKTLFFVGFVAQIVFLIINELIGLKLWLLVSIGIVSSLLSTLEPVNRVAIAKAITTKDQYASTTRLLELMQQLMTFVAGFIGILLIKKMQISYVLIADAFSFLAAFALMHCVKIESKALHHTVATKSGDILENSYASIVKMDRAFYIFGAITLIPFVCIMAQRVIYPAHFETLLHATSMQYSLYTLLYAFGAVIAIGAIGMINQNLDKYLSIFFGVLLYAIAIFCIFIWPTLYVTYAAFFIFSLCHCTIRINRLELIMHLVPTEYFGRVNGKFQSFASIAIIFLSWLPALAMNNYGINAGWLIFLMVSVVPVIMYLYYLRSIKFLSFSALSQKAMPVST
ncbi:MAG: MFS transporter [Gammaproteobacteria bacterium]